jgi:hypothetical protein
MSPLLSVRFPAAYHLELSGCRLHSPDRQPRLADISKCVDAEGNITYTDAGCPEGAQEVDKIHEIPSAEAKKLRPKVPLKDRLRGLLTMDNIPQWGSRHGIWALYGLMSAFSLMAIVRDKRQSLRGQWRTSERRLHLLELLGGLARQPDCPASASA